MRRRVVRLACGDAARLVAGSNVTVFAPNKVCVECSCSRGYGACLEYKIIPTLRQQIIIPKDYHTKHRTEE